MVRIRLRRVGAKNQPSYRVVVTDSRSPRDGRFIEKIGFYNPRTEPATFELQEERALHWLDKGAQPSDAVRRLMEKSGTMARYERLRAGETLETLLAEAAAAAAASPAVDPRTRRDDIVPSGGKKARAKAEAAVEAGAVAEAVAVAEAEVEAEAEEAAVEAEAEAEVEAEAEAEPAEEAEAEAEPEPETEAEPEDE